MAQMFQLNQNLNIINITNFPYKIGCNNCNGISHDEIYKKWKDFFIEHFVEIETKYLTIRNIFYFKSFAVLIQISIQIYCTALYIPIQIFHCCIIHL